MPDAPADLTGINLSDLVASFGWQNSPRLAAGASDWVVFPHGGRYPAEEAYFLQFILYFFESSLTGHPDLDAAAFHAWLARRRAQVERGELVYMAHQMDFLAKVHPAE